MSKETLQCLEKTKQAIAAHQKASVTIEKAKRSLSSGDLDTADELVGQLERDTPDAEGLAALREAIDARRQQITEIRSLEAEDNTPTESAYSASDDEITRYFTPDSEKETEARQVTRYAERVGGLHVARPVAVDVVCGVEGEAREFGRRYVDTPVREDHGGRRRAADTMADLGNGTL